MKITDMSYLISKYRTITDLTNVANIETNSWFANCLHFISLYEPNILKRGGYSNVNGYMGSLFDFNIGNGQKGGGNGFRTVCIVMYISLTQTYCRY